MEAKLTIRDSGKTVAIRVAPVGKNNYTLTVDGAEYSTHRHFGDAWQKAMWMSRLDSAMLEELVLAPLRGVQA